MEQQFDNFPVIAIFYDATLEWEFSSEKKFSSITLSALARILSITWNGKPFTNYSLKHLTTTALGKNPVMKTERAGGRNRLASSLEIVFESANPCLLALTSLSALSIFHKNELGSPSRTLIIIQVRNKFRDRKVLGPVKLKKVPDVLHLFGNIQFGKFGKERG